MIFTYYFAFIPLFYTGLFILYSLVFMQLTNILILTCVLLVLSHSI